MICVRRAQFTMHRVFSGFISLNKFIASLQDKYNSFLVYESGGGQIAIDV